MVKGYINVNLVATALKYYGRNHPRRRKEVEEELKNWGEEAGKGKVSLFYW